MSWFFVALVILSVKGSPNDGILKVEDDDDDLDDGLLQCYTCNSLLGDLHCDTFNYAESVDASMVVKCNERKEEVLSTCIFKKDEEFARGVGLADEDEALGHIMTVLRTCPTGEKCNEFTASKYNRIFRNLLRLPHGQKPATAPASNTGLETKPKEERSDYGSYKTTQCFKLDAKGKDGRGFTIRGCSNNRVAGCLTGNYIDTHESECHVCNQNLCNEGSALIFKSCLAVIIYIEAVLCIVFF